MILWKKKTKKHKHEDKYVIDTIRHFFENVRYRYAIFLYIFFFRHGCWSALVRLRSGGWAWMAWQWRSRRWMKGPWIKKLKPNNSTVESEGRSNYQLRSYAFFLMLSIFFSFSFCVGLQSLIMSFNIKWSGGINCGCSWLKFLKRTKKITATCFLRISKIGHTYLIFVYKYEDLNFSLKDELINVY